MGEEGQVDHDAHAAAEKNLKKRMQNLMQCTKCRNYGKINVFIVNTLSVPNNLMQTNPVSIRGFDVLG